MVATGLTGTAAAVVAISVALAMLMATAALLLMRDVRRLERRLGGASPPSAAGHEARSEALDAKTRFLATVSHEMRTPLNGVLGMADLLAGTEISPEQRTYVSAIRTSGEALLSLIEEILDFSKIDAGKLELVSQPIEPAAVIESVTELLAPRAQDKGLEIAAYLTPDVPRRILSDGARLRQVLLNLAGNAVKFTETGGVGIRASVAGGQLVIEVVDTGPGIPADQIGTIFQEFEQADGSPARRHEGTGLGLSISRRIVEALGGAITVESLPGVGSTFRVNLPLTAAGGSEAKRDGMDLSGEDLLIVSQSRFEAPYLAARLSDAGAGARIVADLGEARAALAAAARPTGLIVDCALGPETARLVAAAAEEAGVARRLVLLSPYERRAFGSPGAAGFNGYMVKPLRARAVFARLKHAVPVAVAAPAVAPAPARVNLKVLLAEDNEINALLAMRLLERHGCAATHVSDGLAALAAVEMALAEGAPFDVALLDIRMPRLDGLETARRLRTTERERRGGHRMRIVALTANAFPADREACLSAGIDAFVAKPLDPARLLAALGSGPARVHKLRRPA